MATSTSSVTGLASGIQWGDLIDQLMSAEQARQLDPLTAQKAAATAKVQAWNAYASAAQKVTDAAKALRDGTAFNTLATTVSPSATSGRTLLAATADVGTAPGSYKVEVLSLASAEKLSGGVVADAGAALGVAGEFVINGRKVTIAATDSLNAVRDRINAVNSGTSPSRVTATVLSTGTNAARLVLTSETSGAQGIEMVDGSSGALAALGLVDGTSAPNATADGGVVGNRFSSVTTSIATMLGVTMPAPSTVTIGGRTIAVDLATDSLASIAARITAAGGTAGTEAVTANGVTQYRLTASGTASATTADGARTLAMLGLTQPGRAAVSQVVQGDTAFTVGGAAATTGTLLSSLDNGPKAGDVLTLRGTRGDGSAAATTLTVGAGTTVQDLLDAMNTSFAGSRAATASLDSSGRLTLSDGTAGDSQLAFSLTSDNAGGGTFSLGRTRATTTGRLREITAGTDAQLRVDGVLLTRSSNTVSDALAGVTLNLQKAEAGTTVDVTVARDTDAAKTALKTFASAYNAARTMATGFVAQGGALAYDGTMRAASQSLTQAMLTDVAGLGGTPYTRGAIVGLALDKNGQLQLDETAFTAAMATNQADVANLFRTGGNASDNEVSYVVAGTATTAGSYAVNITAAATRGTIGGSGFSGVYSDDGSADTMTVTDPGSGKASSVTLAAGDTTDAIVSRLNVAFQSQAMQMVASKDASGQLVLTNKQYGTAAAFTVAYSGGGADGSAQLGLAAGTYAGTDVQGTIGGLAATGTGQVLTGATGGATAGLAINYAGTTARAAGTVGYWLGVGGLMARASDAIGNGATGAGTMQTIALNDTIDSLTTRSSTVQQRLDLRRAALTAQYAAMETALSRLQQQGSALTSQLAALSTSNN